MTRAELRRLNRYYERLDTWNADHGVVPNPFMAPPAEPLFELHDVTRDPEEQHNMAGTETSMRSRLHSVLDEQREAKRRLP